MNYFRLFTKASDFGAGDVLELYLDNMRLVTRPPAAGHVGVGRDAGGAPAAGGPP
jgi:hypothetical protein